MLTMSPSWKAVAPEAAKTNLLYGVRGWLLVFVAALFLGVFVDVGFALREAREAGITVGELFDLEAPSVSFLKTSLWFEAIRLVVIYFMLFTKSRTFRVGATLLMVAQVPIQVILFVAEPFGGAFEIAKTIMSSLFSCAIWAAYLNRSRRVRVTFENMVSAQLHTAQLDAPPVASKMINRSQHMSTADVGEPTSNVDVDASDLVLPELTLASGDPSEAHWSAALTEFDGLDRRAGLWAKSFAQAAGNEAAAKAAYLSARAAQLLEADEAAKRQAVVEKQEARNSIQRVREYRASLNPTQAKIASELEEVERKGWDAFNSMVQLVKLLGGRVGTRSVGLFGGTTEWRAELDGASLQFHNEHALADWVLSCVVDRARAALPPSPKS